MCYYISVSPYITNAGENCMKTEELIKRAQGRLEAMDDAIKGIQEYLHDLYADRQLVAYLLWLNEKKD